MQILETFERLANSARLINIIHRLILLAATEPAEYTSLLNRINERLDYYERNYIECNLKRYVFTEEIEQWKH